MVSPIGRTKGMTLRGKGNVVLVAAQLDDPDGNPTEEYVLLRADEFGRLRTVSPLGDVEIPISASSLKGTGTNGAGDATQLPESAEEPVNLVNYDYIAFDPTTEENAFFQYSIPSGWDEGPITFRVKWTNTAGLATETLVMGLKAVALSDDEALDSAWGTEVTVTDTFLAQNDLHITPESAAVTVGGSPAEGDIVMFNLARKTASDNLTGDARILELILTFTRDSPTD